MQRPGRWSALGASTILLASAGAAEQRAQPEPFVDTPPAPGAICPAIDLDYGLCSENLLSGNCRDFVAAARALGRLYLFNVQREPSRAESLKTSIWWQCGSKDLSELAALLARIDSPAAREVLQSEPYRSLPARAAAGAGSASAPRRAKPIDCDSLPTDADGVACEARQLSASKTAHEQAFEACKKILPEPERGQLIAQERGFRTELDSECADAACTSDAIRQRDHEIQQAFPQCGARD